MPPLPPNITKAGLITSKGTWVYSSMSPRRGTTAGLLSTRTPQRVGVSGNGLPNPSIGIGTLREAMPRNAAGTWRPISLVAPCVVGVNWALGSAPKSGWTDMAYGNGLFVAVAENGTGNRVMTSPDGITWTSRTSAADNGWDEIIYTGDLFVAVATSGPGSRVMTSPDGITWTLRASANDSATWAALAYGNNRIAAAANNVAQTMVSLC